MSSQEAIQNKPEHVIFVETDDNVVRDRPIKSLLKAISWRIIGSIDTMIVSYFITGEWTMAISIGGVEVFTKIILYYLHERAWTMMRWGRMMVVLRRNSRSTKRTFKKIIFWK